MSEPIEAVYELLGRKIRLVRKQAGVSQTKLALRSKMHRNSIMNIEQGKQRIVLHDIVAIANALDLNPMELLEDVLT